MADKGPSMLGFALVLIFVIQVAVAADECKTGCSGASGLLKLTPGTTYKYDYSGKVNILLSSVAGQQTSTEVTASVLLTQNADCSQVLRLQNVQIIGPDGKKRSGLSDVEKPVVLNSNNGELNEFICAEPGDSQNSLNLKRAIASFFQVNGDKSNEIDVFGQCPTSISKRDDGGIITVTKNKNLNKCAFRESITHNYITSTFNIHSEIQSSPVLNSYLDSKQKLKGGVLDSASIEENYLFVPFSVGQNGAKATIESKLTLTGTSNDKPTTKCSVRKSLIFDNPHPLTVQKSNVPTILKKVKEISEKLGTNVEDTTAVQFIDLVKLLRLSKKADILSVYNQVRSGVGFADKEGAKKIFLDAILLAGNGDTIEVAIELLKNKELKPSEERDLFAGLSRARHVTENSIKTATDLLNKPNLPREAFLGVGSLAGRYCSTHKCEKVEVVNKIIQKLLSKLGDLKAANRKEESDMIYVLKGLTNIGYLNDAILAKLVTLAEDKNQPIRLRIATLEAFGAAPCKDKLRDSALKTLQDIQQDSEIRIKAYLVLTQCPNDKIGNAVKALLEQEKSNQVGGFISSHIKNLRSSANPDKALAKKHLGFVHTPSRFTFDPRRYSFNGEFSYAVEALGLANNVEGNVIYSQNSWLPRSTNVNLTAEIFGQRLNFLEVAARQENLDKVIEHYLGPQGVLRKASLQQNWDNAVKPVEDLLKNLKAKIDKSLRARRDVSQAEIEAINKKVQIKTNALDKNLDLDLSIKNFGSEVVFMNSFDVTDKLTPQGIIDKLVGKLNEGLDKLKSFEKTFRTNLLFLDAELSYPTSLGFPLRLGIDGASNILIKTSGNIDARELLSSSPNKDLNLKLSIIPSATISVSGRFSLDTPLLENGLKVTSTIHTSTGGEVLVNSFKQGYGLDVKFNIPVQKQELIGLKHDIIFQTRENGVGVQDTRLKFSQNKDLSICVDQLVSYIGLEFCAEINGPNLSGKKIPLLPFPLSGDAKASVRIERGDINSFHFRKEWFVREEGKVGIETLLETLDANNNKGVSLGLEGFVAPEAYVKATLKSPIKNAEAEARLVYNDQEKLVALSLKDESRVYSAKAGLKVDEGSDKTVYVPILEYKLPGDAVPQIPPFHLEGKCIAVKNGQDEKFTFDNIKLVIPGRESITITGVVGTEGPAYYSDLSATDGKISGSFKGRLQSQANLLKVQGEFQNSINPSLNLKVNGEFKKLENGLVSSNLLIVHGQDLNSKTNAITLINSFNVKNSGAELSTKNKFSYPLMKINAKFDLDKSAKSFEYDTYLQYNDAKLGSEMKLKTNTKAQGDYQLDFGIQSLKNKVHLKSSRQVLGADDSKIDASLSVNGKKTEISGKIKHHVKPNDLNIGADLLIKVPNGKAPWKLNQVIKVNPRDFDLHTKLLSGTTPLIDTLLKGNKAGNLNGFVKVNFKDVLAINGQIKAQKYIGSGDILIEAKSLKKSTKAETTFSLNHPTYNLDFTLYPIFSEDKNKKIALSTKNKCSDSSVASSSSLDILGTKFALDVNGKISSFTNGKTDLDVSLVLPSERNLVAKLVRDVSTKDGIWNLDNSLVVENKENKASPGLKVTIKTVVKDTSIKEGILDIDTHLAISDPKVANRLTADASLKKQKVGDKWKVDYASKITSEHLKNPQETSFSSEYKQLVGNFNLKSSISPKANINIGGNYDFEAKQNPISGELKLNLAIPIDTLSCIETSHSFSLNSIKNTPVTLELGGSLKTVSSLDYLNIDSQGKIQVKADKQSGSLAYQSNIKKPIQADVNANGNYVIDPEKKTGKVNGDLKLNLPAKNQVIQGNFELNRISPKEYTIVSSLDLPGESLKSNQLNIHTICTDENEVKSEITLVTNGQKRLLNTLIKLSQKEPSISFKYTHSSGQVSELSASMKKPTDSQLTANIKLNIVPKNFILEGGLDINSENLNNFHIQLNANAPSFNVKNVFIKIGNEGSNDGKTIDIKVTSDGKNVVSGSATVSSRQEQGKFIVEGSGNFNVEDQAKSGNFKYIRTSLSADKNGENGEEISFDATLGNKAIDAELKLTNKEFRYLNSYCEESKQCAHVEIDAKSNVEDIFKYNNELEISIDLRVLGVPNEFGLKAVTKREGWQLDHTVDVHFENAANKYQYSVYVHPKEVGVSLTTPKRIIALEASADVPTTDLKNGGKANGEIAFYTDKKNNPSSKSSLRGSVDVDVEKRSIDMEVVLNILGQNKPYSVKYNSVVPKLELVSESTDTLILDIFAKEDQKIIIKQTSTSHIHKENYKIQAEGIIDIKSVGLNFQLNLRDTAFVDPKKFTATYEGSVICVLGGKKYDSLIKLAISPKQAYLSSKHLNKVLLEIKSDINLQKGLISVNTHTSGLGLKPVESTLEIKSYNTLKFTQYLKDEPNNKLLVTAAIIPGQIADARAEIQEGDAKKELFHASVSLDEKNFLKPDAGVNSENIKEYTNKARNFVVSQVKETSKKVIDNNKNFEEELRGIIKTSQEALPETSKTREIYGSELSKLKEELANDKTLQDAGELLKNAFNTIASLVGNWINTISEIVERVSISINNAFSGALKTIQNDILPKLKELGEILLNGIKDSLNSIGNIIAYTVAKAAQIVELLQPQFKAIATTVSEISEEVGRFVSKTYESIRAAIIEQVKHIKDELKASPIIAELKAQYEDLIKNGLPSQEVIINTLKAFSGALKEAVVIPEFQKVIDLIEIYLEKKIANKPVDDVAELEKIASTLIDAVAKFTASLSKEAVPDIFRNAKIPSLNFDLFKRLPNSVGALKVSALNYLFKEDSRPIVSFLARLVLRPEDSLIPKPFVAIVDSKTIKTFDNKVYLFPGGCSYLGVSDAVNGNFSVVLTYMGGKLNSLTLTDKSGSMTLKHQKLLVDGAEADYPAYKGTLKALLSSRHTHISSKYGVDVYCQLNKMNGCAVIVSGFYHGQLRGLLGNANNEQYDDLILPNGKITTSAPELAPAYAASAGECAVPSATDADPKPNENCEKLFSWDSSLSPCFPFVDSKPFKRACEYATAAGLDETYETTSLHYAYACTKHNIPVEVPKEYSTACQNSLTNHKVDDVFTATVPSQSADVLLVVNTDKENEGLYKDFVQPLISQLTAEYKGKGITDVIFHMVVYGGENKDAAHVTIKGDWSFKEAPTLRFVEPEKKQKLVTHNEYLDKLIVFIRSIAHNLHNLKEFIISSFKTVGYPFRAEAVRTVLLVTKESCELDSALPLKFVESLLPSSKEITVNVISPVKGLKVKDPATTKNVIGFNNDNVITLSECAAKPEGTPALHKDLSHNDACTSFALGIGSTVFVTDNLQANANAKDQIVQTIAKNIVNQSLSKQIQLECTCGYSIWNTFTPYNRCNVVDIKDK